MPQRAASEDIHEQDRIQAEISQERSTSEIQKLAAREMASGTSTQTTSSYSEAGGYSDGGGLTGLLGGGSVNENFGYTEGATVTVASSSGQRNLEAEMAQEIQDRTRQASTAVRSKRASLVTETTTTESEEIRTRILTNYNHSHALTIQYYEVVQIYRTEVRLNHSDRVLFIPIKTIDFRDPAVIAQFKHVLMASVTDPSIRRSLSKFINDIQLKELHSFRANALTYQVEGELFLKSAALRVSAMIQGDVKLIIKRRDGETFELDYNGGRGTRTLEEPVPMTDLASISVDYPSYRGDVAQSVDLWLAVAQRETMAGLKGYHFRCGLMGSSSAGSSEPQRREQMIVSAHVEGMDPNTIDYLQEHALPLSQAIWASLNQQQLATILGGYEFRGSPLLEVIDVKPITFFGNYLVFRHHPNDRESLNAWAAWRESPLEQRSFNGAGRIDSRSFGRVICRGCTGPLQCKRKDRHDSILGLAGIANSNAGTRYRSNCGREPRRRYGTDPRATGPFDHRHAIPGGAAEPNRLGADHRGGAKRLVSGHVRPGTDREHATGIVG